MSTLDDTPAISKSNCQEIREFWFYNFIVWSFVYIFYFTPFFYTPTFRLFVVNQLMTRRHLTCSIDYSSLIEQTDCNQYLTLLCVKIKKIKS